MKVRVNFTVEFDADQYRRVFAYPGSKRLSDRQIRNMIQNSAMDRITFGLSDDGVECDAVHNN